MESLQLNLLKQVVREMASEVNYNFCLGCYCYGKMDEFESIICLICKEPSCSFCNGIHTRTIESNDHKLCGCCNKVLSSDTVILMKVSIPDKSINMTQDITEDMIEKILDQIEENLNGTEYFQYELNCIDTFKNNEDIYLLVEIRTEDGIEDGTEDKTEDGIDINTDDVIDEIILYLDSNDGQFEIDQSSSDDSETIIYVSILT